jgi:hypothetical protein
MRTQPKGTIMSNIWQARVNETVKNLIMLKVTQDKLKPTPENMVLITASWMMHYENQPENIKDALSNAIAARFQALHDHYAQQL